jgi:CRP-like cAMP-binding protein
MSSPQNHLIECLPRRDRGRLLALAQQVPLVVGEVLYRNGETTRHVYFPVDGFVSLIAPIGAEPSIEVGMVGREGMLGVQLALGVGKAPLHALVQGPGSAWRVGTRDFRGELATGAALRRVLGQYVYVLMSQLAGATACVRFHEIGPRLARWLLMSQDRAHADHFHVTHEFMASMLGVRRVGITAAAVALHRQGLIDYRRGELTVLDRCGLEAAACDCYAEASKAYAELLG